MILLMNIIIALAGFVGIIAARKLSKDDEELELKNHFVILGIKVVFISAIVSIFYLSTEKNTHALLILTGLLNLIVFHFIEAFVTQKKLIKNRNLNV
jgi:cell division protein FtsW (lipid II flippase)